MEEKLGKLAQRLTELPTQQAYVKLPGRQAYLWHVPFVRRYLLNPASILEYEKALQQDAIPIHEAERILKDQEKTFLERSREYERGFGRPKKKPARLCP